MLRIWLLALCAVSVQLWTRGHTQELTDMFCDDVDVEAAVDLALVYHNARLPHGNQLALYQILKAEKAVNESGTYYTIHILARVSDCPVGGDKSWRDCDYLPHGDKIPTPCIAVLHKSSLEEIPKVLSFNCRSNEPRVTVERVQCLGCREKIDVYHDDLKEPLFYSVAKFNAENSSSHHFILYEVASATRQVVAGFRYDVLFTIVKSNCSKSDFKEITDECHPHPTDAEYANCSSTVYIAPWRREEPEAHMNCEPTRLATGFSRRRPPGWSPLRHFNYFAAKLTPTPTPTPTPAPSPTSKKESSEEESQEVTTQTPVTADASVTQTPEDPALSLDLPLAEPVSSFRCPTSPWKQFVSTTVPPPTAAKDLLPLDEALGALDF